MRERGLCPKCGKENPTPERSMCPDRTENTMKGLGYALIVGKIQQNLTKSYVMSAWVNFKIVIRKKGKPMNRKRKIG